MHTAARDPQEVRRLPALVSPVVPTVQAVPKLLRGEYSTCLRLASPAKWTFGSPRLDNVRLRREYIELKTFQNYDGLPEQLPQED